jgi:DNA modification methylase
MMLDEILQGDCLELLPQLPPDYVDMVFFDPPYFLQLPKKRLVRWEVRTLVEGVNEEWDKFSSFQEYDEFIGNILKEVRRVMKPKATIWAIGTYHSIFRIGRILQDLGFWILNDVIWVKTNPMPNWLNVRFTNATETLIWAVREKGAKGYTYHPQVARSFENGKIATNVWYIPLCTGKERLRDEQGRKLHPTQKPEALLERIILVSTNKGDIVLDPVAGTGTTGYVAKKLGRHFIMIERQKKYAIAAKERLKFLSQPLLT